MPWRREWQPTRYSCLENPRDGGLGMQPWALSLPDKELCLREALAVCTPPAPERVPQSTGIIRGTEFQTGSSTALLYRARTAPGWVDNAEPSLALGGPSPSILCPERSLFPQQSCQRSQGPETSAGGWPMLMPHFKTLCLPSTPRSKQRGGALELGPKAQCVLL